tara:strand:- start:2355 stop:2732 length:378 start_codon:yes stop_codon:yes gene_type:complete
MAKLKEIFIPGNVPSSKNSKQWTGKMLINSKATRAYIKATMGFYMGNKVDFQKMLKGREKPYRVSLQFIRGTKHKFDYINPAQTVQDLMVKYNWIKDDNCEEIIPVFEEYKYDKKNPGVIIKILS